MNTKPMNTHRQRLPRPMSTIGLASVSTLRGRSGDTLISTFSFAGLHIFGALVLFIACAIPCTVRAQVENWVRLTNGVPRDINIFTTIVGGFITVPTGQGDLTVTVKNVSYTDLWGNPTPLGSYEILGRAGSTPRGTYPVTTLVPDPGVLSDGAGVNLHVSNPSSGDYFVAAYSFYKMPKSYLTR